MTKTTRVDRPKDEIKRELREQLALLRHSCQSFDGGFEATGRHISLSLRVLLHQHKQSRSLLDQLGLRQGRFVDTAGALNPRNLLPEAPLTALHISEKGARYLPLIALGAPANPPRAVLFAEWWGDPVLKDNKGRRFCRRELVQHVADTDGGAHVDPTLDEAYMAISRSNSLGWTFVAKGQEARAPEGRPELACMRQIAHEVLCTISGGNSEFRSYAEPVVPPPIG